MRLAAFLWLSTVLILGCGGSRPSVATKSNPMPLQVTLERIGRSPSEEPTLDRALIDEAAQSVAAGVLARKEQDHGALPEVLREEADAQGGWPGFIVHNDTPHGLVVWFAGSCPRTIALAPGARFDGEICEGSYDIAAELSSEDYLPFVGEANELESGYNYSLTFYVVAAPRTRTILRRR